MTDIELLAWAIYCEETTGSMHVVDFWSDLRWSVQLIYLNKATKKTDGAFAHRWLRCDDKLGTDLLDASSKGDWQ